MRVFTVLNTFNFFIIWRFEARRQAVFPNFSGSDLLHIIGTFRFPVYFMQNLDDRVIREFGIGNSSPVLQF